MPTRQLIIKGKVQGVFFRASAKETANQWGITGWIKNTANGDVEAMVSGTENQLQHFLKWCWHGPSGAEVTEVIQSECPETFFDDFSILRRE